MTKEKIKRELTTNRLSQRERLKEIDIEDENTQQDKLRKLEEQKERERENPEKNNESPLPPTKPAMSALTTTSLLCLLPPSG